MLNKLFIYCIVLYSANIFSTAQQLPNLEQCEPTFKMLDASAKIPSGILAGNLVEMGAFDECLKINEPSASGTMVKGKYCLVKVKLPLDKLTPKMFQKSFYNPKRQDRAMVVQDPTDSTPGIGLGWCIPDICPINNITSMLSPYLNFINASVSPLYGSGMCQTIDDGNKELTSSDWIVIAFFIFIGLIILLSTLYDIYLHYTKQEPAHIGLVAFSVKTNGKKLLAISKNPQQLPCLHGIRFLSMMWVIYGHRLISSAQGSIINLAVTGDWLNNTANMYVINAPVSVDTFFLLSGLLVGYGFLLAKDKGAKFNILLYYLHRYIRLTPALGVVVLIHATLLDRFGSGPFWSFTSGGLQTACKDYWWSTILYIQNYYNPDTMCLGQSWYLSIDTQLFVLSPLVLLPLWRWPKYTLIGSALLVVGSMVSSFVVSYHYDLSGIMIGQNPDYMRVYYTATHTRFGPWLMGIMLGYCIYRLKKRQPEKLNLHPLIVCVGWIIALALLLSTLFSAHVFLVQPDRLGSAFFNGLHRHGWSLGVCIVIYLCTEEYGGPINAFLSWSVFQVLGRFTYTMYLIHLSLQFLLVASARTNGYFSDFNNAYTFWGDFAFTLFFAICLTLSFESPMLTLEKVIFGTGSKPKREQLPVHQNENGNETALGQTNGGFERTE